MTIAGGIFLIAVGAILKFATNVHVQGVSVDTVGLILMLAGAAGLILGLFQEVIWSNRARRGEVVVPAERVEQVPEERRDLPPRY
jgi:hypothetical protein